MMKKFNIGGVPEHYNLPWHLAMESNLFAEKGINMNWKDYPGGTGAMCRDLQSGELDIAILLTEGIVAELSRHDHSRIVQFYVLSPLVWGIHVSAMSSFTEMNQLKGKRYAISRPGSGSHLMAQVDAAARGWTLSAEQFVTVGTLDGAREALAKGDADIFMWEKFMTKPYVDNGEFRRIAECPTPWACFALAVRKEILDKYEHEITSISDIINASTAAFMKDPGAVSKISARYKLKPEDVANWYSTTKWASERSVSAAVVEKVSNTLMNLGIIDAIRKPGELCSSITRLI